MMPEPDPVEVVPVTDREILALGAKVQKHTENMKILQAEMMLVLANVEVDRRMFWELVEERMNIDPDGHWHYNPLKKQLERMPDGYRDTPTQIVVAGSALPPELMKLLGTQGTPKKDNGTTNGRHVV